MIKLNQGQEFAVNAIVSGFLESDAPGFTLIGEGGTGKTTCVMHAAERLQQAGMKILFIAPTNKAVKQLEKSAREYGLSLNEVGFMTAHKALGLAMLPDEENKFAVQLGNGCFDLFDVVVCDEASMLSRIVLNKYILPMAEDHNARLLFMGDDMQLPPVKETKSLAFEIFPTFRLTEVERQKEGSGILTVTGALRTAMATGEKFTQPAVDSDVEVVLASKFLKTVVDAFDADTNLDDQRVLCWRNRRVDEINNAIRNKIYGKDAARFEIGERVVTGSPIKANDEIILSTDEECIVTSVTESSVFDEDSGMDFKTTLLALKTIHSNSGQVFAHVLHATEEDRYWDHLNAIAKQAKSNPSASRMHWARYHKFKDMFATIKYCYAITVHRSQGSTYGTVFVDVNDILANNKKEERRRLLYVSFSRPRDRLVTNKMNYVT